MAKKLVTPLIAGGGSASGAINAGEVILLLANDQLTVTYRLNEAFAGNGSAGDSRDDWGISEIHFDFGLEKTSIPVTRSGDPQIGRFDFGGKTAVFVESEDPSEISFTVADVTEADLSHWAAHATVSQRDAVEAFNESLPDQVTFQMTDDPSSGDTSYWKNTVTSPDETWLNGTFDGWCVDTSRTMSAGTTYKANVYSSLEDELTGIVDKGLNFDRVNWLLNNADLLVGKTLKDEISFGTFSDADSRDYVNGGVAQGDIVTGTGAGLGEITYADIQRAIWGLIDDSQSTSGIGGWSAARADELADRAYVYGYGFSPECDDKVAVIFQPINGSGQTVNQVTIGQVTMISPTGSCEGRDETAWAITGGIAGLGGEGVFGRSWAEYNRGGLVDAMA